ncbi:DUF417 family protein [Pararhizobium sp. PWRC1-1]|uniref:DUF417 family protein n=1 Tax=Pararhizobium sp. PWRC1-1 TaxID=2804566 RepID=UPI003CF3C485
MPAYLLGVVEIAAALLLIACPWSARAIIAGCALATLTFLVTCSIMDPCRSGNRRWAFRRSVLQASS